MIRCRVACVVAVLGLLCCLGCGENGPKKFTVSGTVTYNNAPLPKGRIVFAPTDGAVAPDAGEIVGGKYSFAALPGAKRVEITAEREAGGGVDAVMGQAKREQYLAEKYNIATTLTATVTPAGPNTFDYDVSD
jgi:hypothetical protein